MSYNLVLEIEPRYHYLDIATSIFKITLTQLICMINWPNFIQSVILTNFIMPKVYIKLACMLRHKRSPNKLKIKNIRKRSFNYKSPYSMNWKKFLTPSHSYLNYLQTQQSMSFHKVVCFIKKRSMRKLEQSFKKLLTWLVINAISPIILLYATTRWNHWLHL